MITPRITGTGLFTLDAVPIPGSPQYRLFAGGSSINVLTILATEGWDAYPVGRIGRDRASAYFMQDLSRFGLNLDFILQKTESAMPVYVQISHAESHQFVRQCPACGVEFSHYDAISEAEAEAITAALPGPLDWVYLERVAPGALHFAKRCKAKGARLYFEPNRIDKEDLFLECLRLADVFKYSHERFEMMEHRSGSIPIPLEIETWGKQGLRYRTASNRAWRYLPAFPAPHFIDAAGSGDWLSATFLRQIHAEEWEMVQASEKSLQNALNHGQRQSAVNCAFAGARGRHYTTRSILHGQDFCPSCSSPPQLE